MFDDSSSSRANDDAETSSSILGMISSVASFAGLEPQRCVQRSVCEVHRSPERYGKLGLPIRYFLLWVFFFFLRRHARHVINGVCYFSSLSVERQNYRGRTAGRRTTRWRRISAGWERMNATGAIDAPLVWSTPLTSSSATSCRRPTHKDSAPVLPLWMFHQQLIYLYNNY